MTGLHSRYWAPDALEHFGQVNPIKGGIIFADQVTTVSPTYAQEIQTSALGAGVDGILRSLSFKLTGILNPGQRDRRQRDLEYGGRQLRNGRHRPAGDAG